MLPASSSAASDVVVAIAAAFRGEVCIRPIDPLVPEAVFHLQVPAFSEPIKISYKTLSPTDSGSLHSLLDFLFEGSRISVRSCCTSAGGELSLEFRQPLQLRPWEKLLYRTHGDLQDHLYEDFMYEAASCLVRRLSDVAAIEEVWLSADIHSWLLDFPTRFPDPRPSWVKLLTAWKMVRERQATHPRDN